MVCSTMSGYSRHAAKKASIVDWRGGDRSSSHIPSTISHVTKRFSGQFLANLMRNDEKLSRVFGAVSEQ